MDNQNGLVIVQEPKNPTGEYRLRYVDGESRKRRDLGPVPFTSATLTQHKQTDGSWILVLSGKAGGKSEIVVTDETAIRGRLQNDSDRNLLLRAGLTYKDVASGESKTMKLAALMGTDMSAIYQVQEKDSPDKNADYAKFLWDGGGIFQLGLQYGAGIKYRIHPRVSIALDFRETWSKNPRFVTDSFTDDFFAGEGMNNYDITRVHIGADSAFRQDRLTLGFAFTF